MTDQGDQQKDQSDSVRIVRERYGPNGYFSMSRSTAQDRSLSWEARGVLVYLLSKPDDWTVQVGDLKQFCGRDKVYKMLAELETARYLVRFNLDVIRGRRWAYRLYERPAPLPEMPQAEKSLAANTDLTDIREETNIREEHIPTPAKSAKGFTRLPKSKNTSRDDVSYESDDAKTTYKPSALELVVRAEFPGIKSIPKASVARLSVSSAPHLSSIQYTAPDDMYERYPLYAQWLDEKILAYFRTLPDAKDYRAGPKHLINLICRSESLTDPKHGFLIYQQTFAAMKLVGKLQQQQTTDMINKIQSDGTGEVPGWMRDASELDDSVFG